MHNIERWPHQLKHHSLEVMRNQRWPVFHHSTECSIRNKNSLFSKFSYRTEMAGNVREKMHETLWNKNKKLKEKKKWNFWTMFLWIPDPCLRSKWEGPSDGEVGLELCRVWPRRSVIPLHIIACFAPILRHPVDGFRKVEKPLHTNVPLLTTIVWLYLMILKYEMCLLN